jgi:hypothetical protein
MAHRFCPRADAEDGQGLLEYILILSPLTVLVALGVLMVVISGSS